MRLLSPCISLPTHSLRFTLIDTVFKELEVVTGEAFKRYLRRPGKRDGRNARDDCVALRLASWTGVMFKSGEPLCIFMVDGLFRAKGVSGSVREGVRSVENPLLPKLRSSLPFSLTHGLLDSGDLYPGNVWSKSGNISLRESSNRLGMECLQSVNKQASGIFC